MFVTDKFGDDDRVNRSRRFRDPVISVLAPAGKAAAPHRHQSAGRDVVQPTGHTGDVRAL